MVLLLEWTEWTGAGRPRNDRRYAAGRQNSSNSMTRRLGQKASSSVRITAQVWLVGPFGASARRADPMRFRNNL
jgi:hypothetical protein